MGLSTPRLYRKRESGIYFVRILLMYPANAKAADGTPGKGPNKVDVKRSLFTANPKLAGKIVAVINAALAQVPMSARPHVFEDLYAKVMSGFMGPDSQSMHIEGREDMQNFLGFFEDLNQPGLEDFKGVFNQRVAQRGIYTQAPSFTVKDAEDRSVAIDLMKELARPEMADLKEAMLARLRGRPIEGAQALAQPVAPQIAVVTAPQASLTAAVSAPHTAHHEGSPRPHSEPLLATGNATVRARAEPEPHGEVDNPTIWRVAIDRYVKSMKSQKKRGNDKTLSERQTLANQFENFMVSQFGYPRDFYVHQVKKFHVTAFMDDSASRLARGVTKKQALELAPGAALPTIGPATILKRISSLVSIFRWAYKDAGMTLINAADHLEDRRAAHTKDQNENSESYEPFTESHLLNIFKPARYLEECRDADHFWVPLLGAHLGGRLGEFVNVPLENIQQHALNQIWYIDIRPEDAKNANSVRRLPITQPLIDIGFVDYVLKLKALGAKTLFPHRNMTTVSAKRQPSKNVSEKFARFLDVCEIVDPKLVFHSFRHTLVNALMHAGVPLTICQQIVGHMAQDEAVRKGLITQEQARSVTMTVYTHKNMPSMHVADPFRMLKDALEDNFKLPLDYARLKKAADVVLQHVRKDAKSKTGFDCGWAPQNLKYTEKMLNEVGRD